MDELQGFEISWNLSLVNCVHSYMGSTSILPLTMNEMKTKRTLNRKKYDKNTMIEWVIHNESEFMRSFSPYVQWSYKSYVLMSRI